MKIVTAEHAKLELGRLVRQSVKSHEAFRITHEEGDAVLMSGDDYDMLMETLELLSHPGHEQTIGSADRRPS